MRSRVDVRTRYERGQWAGGYEIAQVVELGYRIRRPGSLDTLPDIFVPADVRHDRRLILADAVNRQSLDTLPDIFVPADVRHEGD